ILASPHACPIVSLPRSNSITATSSRNSSSDMWAASSTSSGIRTPICAFLVSSRCRPHCHGSATVNGRASGVRRVTVRAQVVAAERVGDDDDEVQFLLAHPDLLFFHLGLGDLADEIVNMPCLSPSARPHPAERAL